MAKKRFSDASPNLKEDWELTRPQLQEFLDKLVFVVANLAGAPGDISNEVSSRQAEDVLLSNAISNLTSAHNVLSNFASGLNSAHNALSNVVSNIISSGGGGTSVTSNELSAVSAQAASALNVTSNVLSNLISAHNVLSNRVSANSGTGGSGSVTSTELSNVLSVANAASNAASVVSQALSAAAAALSVRIDTQSQSISAISQQVSVLSQQVSVLSQLHSALSQAHSVLSNVVSNEISNRISADNALSNLISAVSNAVSIVSQAVSAELSNRVSADNALSVRIDTQSQAISVLSQAHSVVSNALSNEISNRTSADNVLSLRLQSILSVDISVLSQGLSVISQQVSALSQLHSVLSSIVSNLISAHNVLSNRVSANSGTGGSGSVTSTELSNALSVLSAAVLSFYTPKYMFLLNSDASAASAGHAVYLTLSADAFAQADGRGGVLSATGIGLVADTVISAGGSGRIQYTGFLQLTSTQWDEVTGDVGGLTPGTVYYMTDGGVNGTIQAAVPGAPFSRIHKVGVAIDKVNMLIQQGEDVAFQLEVVSAISAISQQVSALSQAHSVLSQVVSNEISNRTSADNVLSLRIQSVLSVDISVLSQQVSILSQKVSAFSQLLSATGQVVPQVARRTGVTLISAATLTNVPSLVISCAAGVYLVDGQLIFECATSGGFAFGFSAPALAADGSFVHMVCVSVIGQNAAQAEGNVCLSAVAAGQTAVVSVSIATVNSLRGVRFDGMLNVSTAGTFQIMARSSVAGASMSVRGGYLRAYRIG